MQTEWKKQYHRLTEEERKTYHRDKMRKYRKEKREYHLQVLRWVLWRYIDEKKIFNAGDYKYLNNISNDKIL